MSCSLVIMAAGIGSRFKGGVKQLTPVGPNGELIMDYSVHDAVLAGFDQIIFVINQTIESSFQEMIGQRVGCICRSRGVKVSYAVQRPDDLPAPFSLPPDRVKPWGTGQAVLACRDLLDGPFAIVNSDDFYGAEPFRLIHDCLTDPAGASCCMAGFRLRNTVTRHGGVTRGLCELKEGDILSSLQETRNVCLKPDGSILAGDRLLDPNTPVSMNFFGFPFSFLQLLQEGFVRFLSGPDRDLTKDEYLVPILVNRLTEEGRIRVRVLETTSRWLGMTYAEDTEAVRRFLAEMTAQGIYPARLYEDLSCGQD